MLIVLIVLSQFAPTLTIQFAQAVAVLLKELGAPPRLQTHIAGESLLNDGAAVVFFQIFSARFFHEMGVEGVGEEIGWSRGIVLFLRLSLGGAVIGCLFGALLVIMLFNLNRRLSREESVFQVTGTLAIAYLSYFVSEVLLHCSGILAVVFCGLTTKSFGETVSRLFVSTSHQLSLVKYGTHNFLFVPSSSMTII